MEWIVSIVSAANSLTPLAIIGLLVIIMLLQAKGRKEVSAISDNHLSDMPEVVDTLRRIEGTLQRLEVKLSEDLSYIRARINGGSK